MKPAALTTFAERVGRTLGGLWRGCVRLDRRATHLLVAKGWAPGIAKAAMLLIKLAMLGVLVYAVSWLALLLLFAVIAAWAARNVPSEDEDGEAEWRMGWSGYGLYRGETRIDPGHSADD